MSAAMMEEVSETMGLGSGAVATPRFTRFYPVRRCGVASTLAQRFRPFGRWNGGLFLASDLMEMNCAIVG